MTYSETSYFNHCAFKVNIAEVLYRYDSVFLYLQKNRLKNKIISENGGKCQA